MQVREVASDDVYGMYPRYGLLTGAPNCEVRSGHEHAFSRFVTRYRGVLRLIWYCSDSREMIYRLSGHHTSTW